MLKGSEIIPEVWRYLYLQPKPIVFDSASFDPGYIVKVYVGTYEISYDTS